MATKDDLLDFYRQVLHSASMEVEDNGCVNAALGGESAPKLVDGQRLVIPVASQLKNPDWEERIAFHPIEENILRGESKIIETLRKDFNTKLNLGICTLLFELMTLAASKAEISKLTPDQIQVLTLVPEASEKDLDFLKALFRKMPFDQAADSPVYLYIKRGGRTKEKGWRRLGVASFPLFNALVSGEPKVFGVKPPSTKVRENVTKLLNYIIPNQNDPTSYNCGSDDETAPYFDALLKLFMGLAAPINDAVDMFSDALTDSDSLLIEADWVDAAADLGQFKRLIPTLKGNQGSAAENETVEAEVAAKPAPAAAAQPAKWVPGQVNQQPAPAPRPVTNTNGGVSFADLQRSNSALHQQPQQYQQQNNNGYFPNNQPAGGAMPGSGSVIGGTNWANGGNRNNGCRI